MSNLNRKQSARALFEIARVFLKRGEAGRQPSAWPAGLRRPPARAMGRQERARVDFTTSRADVEALLAPRVAEFRKDSHPALHPGRTGRVLLDGVVIGVLGELHPQWVQNTTCRPRQVLFELDFAALLAASRWPPAGVALAAGAPRLCLCGGRKRQRPARCWRRLRR